MSRSRHLLLCQWFRSLFCVIPHPPSREWLSLRGFCPPCVAEERLGVLLRPQGCLLVGSGPSWQPLLPPVSCQWIGVSVHSPLLWPLHGPSGFSQGHGSCVSHSSRPRHPDTQVSGQLVGPHLFKSGVLVGMGQVLGPCRHLDIAMNLAFCHLSGDVSGEPLLEGFPFAEVGFEPGIAIQRLSVLQAVKRRCLAQSSGSSLLLLLSRYG